MKHLVQCDATKCKGCNRCLRVCPVEGANHAVVIDGACQVQLDPVHCIHCGACITVCQHESRYYVDDTMQFFQDLKSGKEINLIVAPAGRTNFDNLGGTIAWLRSIGAQAIFDVSLGADICTWAHIRWMKQKQRGPLITQPCPAIVNYITKYRTELVDRLSPVHSPMLCTAIFMKKVMGVSGKIAALSPCIAKGGEFESTGLIDYNVTFQKLKEYITSNNIHLQVVPVCFDHIDASLGRLYPMPGGLKENLEFHLGGTVRVDRAEGPSHVYKMLDQYAREPAANLPNVFDVLNCSEGCNQGSGGSHDISVFQIQEKMGAERQLSTQPLHETDSSCTTDLFERFDRRLTLDDFLRTYRVQKIPEKRIDDAAVESAFQMLGKQTEPERKHNCSACGFDTCLEMAVHIARGENVPENCIEKNRKTVQKEHSALMQAKEINAANIVQMTAEINEIKQLYDDVLRAVKDMDAAVTGYRNMANVVSSIAMETNLLALNASIEAARAGQFGDGFSVVAEAIRKLAMSSQQAVKESMDTSQFADKAVAAIDVSSQKVNQSLEKVTDYLSDIAG